MKFTLFIHEVNLTSDEVRDIVIKAKADPEFQDLFPKPECKVRVPRDNSERAKSLRNLEDYLADKPVGHVVSRHKLELELAKKNLEFFPQGMTTALTELRTAGKIEKINRTNYRKLK